MICYLCATPYHVITAMTMASGMYAGQPSTLVLLNHFADAQRLSEDLGKTGLFDNVILSRDNNSSFSSKLKRLLHVFFPDKLYKNLANSCEYHKFICFALDFINISYIMKKYRKKGIACEFSFADDGIGSYISPNIYTPGSRASLLLKLSGKGGYIDSVKDLYILKPEYVIANKRFNLIKIEQNSDTYKKVSEAVSLLWSIDSNVSWGNSVLFFEQPMVREKNEEDTRVQKDILMKAKKKTGREVVVKIHPRSQAGEYWKDFSVMKSRVPFEAMLLQKAQSPLVFMTVNSTAPFSAYLFEGMEVPMCPIILTEKLCVHPSAELIENLSVFCAQINSVNSVSRVFFPENAEEYEEIIESISIK